MSIRKSNYLPNLLVTYRLFSRSLRLSVFQKRIYKSLIPPCGVLAFMAQTKKIPPPYLEIAMARLLKKKAQSTVETPPKEIQKVVLVADDSEMVRNFHSYILKNAGFKIISAIDGADALEKLLQNDVDLVVTDINMPNMDGYEFVKRIRGMDGYEDLPVIIISTESEAQDKQKGYDAGANVYIIKPTPPEQLVESINLLI